MAPGCVKKKTKRLRDRPKKQEKPLMLLIVCFIIHALILTYGLVSDNEGEDNSTQSTPVSRSTLFIDLTD